LPSEKGLNQGQRLQSAKRWLETYCGQRIVKGYSNRYGVDLMCAIRELQLLGLNIEPAYIKNVQTATQSQKKRKHHPAQLRVESEESSDSTLYFTAGYTSGGAPYGLTWEEMKVPMIDDGFFNTCPEEEGSE